MTKPGKAIDTYASPALRPTCGGFRKLIIIQSPHFDSTETLLVKDRWRTRYQCHLSCIAVHLTPETCPKQTRQGHYTLHNVPVLFLEENPDVFADFPHLA